MKKTLVATIIVMAMSLIIPSFTTFADQPSAGKDEHNRSLILAQVKILKATSADADRVRLVKNLSESIYSMNANDRTLVSDAELRALSSLLQDPNDGVKMYAAIALGNIGPRAINYVPCLKDALKSSKFPPPGQIGPQLGSASAIYKAIEKITKRRRKGGEGS